MGVKHFFIHLKNNHANSMKTIRRDDKSAEIDVDILAIDMNGIFHTVAQQVYEYGNFKPHHKRLLGKKRKIHPTRFFAKVCESIEYYRRLVNPKKKLLLCVDGIAGISKLTQQRGRRFVSVKNAKDEDINLEKFNPNAISTGTKLMHDLNQYIHWFIQTQISMNPEYQGLEVIFSNDKVFGEGEHKIINYMRKNKELGESIAIHGMDADLIFLSLALPTEKVYIVRDDSYRYNEIHILDISNIRQELTERLTENVPQNKRTIIDFVLMCYVVGNDFLPAVPGIEILQGGIDAMISIYIENLEDHGHLTSTYKNTTNINKKSFKEFIKSLASIEEEMIDEKLQKKHMFFEDELVNNCSYMTKDNVLKMDMEKYKNAYYKKKFPENTSIKDICFEYFKGLNWVITYYTFGNPSWEWVYPYDYSPFMSDLVTYFDEYKHQKFVLGEPVEPFEQLLMVLPERSKDLLPVCLQDVSQTIPEYFPEDFEVDISGKRRQWEGIVRLPRIDIDKFKEFFQMRKESITNSEAYMNKTGSPYSYTHNHRINKKSHSIFFGSFTNHTKLTRLDF